MQTPTQFRGHYSDDDGNSALRGKDDYDDQDNIQKVLIIIMMMVVILNTDFIP